MNSSRIKISASSNINWRLNSSTPNIEQTKLRKFHVECSEYEERNERAYPALYKSAQDEVHFQRRTRSRCCWRVDQRKQSFYEGPQKWECVHASQMRPMVLESAAHACRLMCYHFRLQSVISSSPLAAISVLHLFFIHGALPFKVDPVVA